MSSANLQIDLELESFSYSVSLDLRAPLRTMQGNATAFLEDCASGLDQSCREYAEQIISASQRMDTLIQDLLALQPRDREQIVLQPVGLSVVLGDAKTGRNSTT